MAEILDNLKATLGDVIVEKILKSKLLVVGAGGIGCELLKNLALTGFSDLEVIDLDTIDVSNLNRQLLFRSQHVGQPKCTVGCQVASELAIFDNVSYEAYHGNVCDNSQFHVEYIKKFDVILSALDNVTARRRVNRLALATGVPLIEAGTTGYLGQVKVLHKPSHTACYECQTQETGKVYPICTIRSTPTAPVHCIVWAKELYKLVFGEKMEESMLYEVDTMEVPSTYMKAVKQFRESKDAAAARQVIQVLYNDEIQKQLDMDRYKTAQKKPSVLSLDIVNTTVDPPGDDSHSTDVWSLAECVAEALACLTSDDVLPVFDKDDDIAMKFVAATANLRMHVFSILPLQSLYSAKGIAGNIIPAIATTNAVVAGLQILQVFQILKAQLESKSLSETCSYVNCVRNSTRNGLFLTVSALDEPNPNCFVCSKATLPVLLKLPEWNLQDFLDKIVKKDLGFEAPTIMLEESGDTIWEEGDGADTESFAKNLEKKLVDLPCGGIQHNTAIFIEDFTQDLTVKVAISHVKEWDDEETADPQKFVVGGQKPTALEAKKPAVAATTAQDDSDDIEIVVGFSNRDKKRRAVYMNGDAPTSKKAKSEPVDVIDID